MKWDTFLEKYKRQKNFDEQLELLKLYHENFVLWEFIKKHFYEFWNCTKFEVSQDYYSLLSLIIKVPLMYKVLNKYLYLILLDTCDFDVDHVINLLMRSGVEIKIDDSFETFLNNYLLSHDHKDNCKLIKVLYLKDKEEKYVRFLIQEQLNKIINTEQKYLNYPTDIYQQMIDLLILDLKKVAVQEGIEDTIHYVGKGTSSEVFQIGQYVLKIGTIKECSINNDCNYFLWRSFYKEFVNNNLCIEIMPFIDTTHITENDVYMMYKKNREDGYLWCDPNSENMGTLLFDTTPLMVETPTLGRQFLGISSFRKQYKGDQVIIDLDYHFNLQSYSKEKREELVLYYLKKYRGYAIGLEEQYQKDKIKKYKY